MSQTLLSYTHSTGTVPRSKKVTPARRKRRWIGISFAESITSKDALHGILSENLVECKSWKIFDFKSGESVEEGVAILRVDRSDEMYVRGVLSTNEFGVVSTTSSGKIRLVRDRMNIVKKKSNNK